MNRKIEQNIQQIKQRLKQIIEIETIKYLEFHPEDHAAQFIKHSRKHLETLFEGEWKGNILNGISKPKRKEFLQSQGISIEGLKNKQMDVLVKDLLLTQHFSDYKEWIQQYYVQRPELWSQLKEKALQVQHKNIVEQEVKEIIFPIFQASNVTFYLPLRSQLAIELATDLKNNRFEWDDESEELVECGPFDVSNYFKVDDFLQQFSGNETEESKYYLHYREYETYEEKYESLVIHYIYSDVVQAIIKRIPLDRKHRFEGIFTEDRWVQVIYELLEEELQELVEEYFSRVCNELLEDMLTLAQIPFHETQHKDIYIQQLTEKKAKIHARKRKEYERFEKERAEKLAKQKQEEEMILQMIGREYEAHISPFTKYILHIGETNTGKTYTALSEMKKANTGLYLGPLRLLALEVYETLTNDGVRCGLKTGEEEKDLDGATHISATVEMFSSDERYDCVVIDEAQMIGDKDRGFSWYKAITSVQADTVHIIGSRNVKNMLLHILEGNDIEIKEYERKLPLTVQQKNFKISKVTKGDALIVFSRKKVLQVASKLEADGHKVSVIYGGMPPETRQKQMEQFHKGETEVVVSTDAIGMGLNLPIRRVIFLENQKFDGTRVRTLTSQEIKQIAGRAGRKGMYEEGFVAFSSDVKKMKYLLEKKDYEIERFAISPTQNIFNRFRQFGKDLQEFFRLWHEYKNPHGTVKAPLIEEKELYEEIRGTEIEARLSVAELYSYLHLPFSSYEPSLKEQWKENMFAIVFNHELQEPIIKRSSLDELELSYKAIGLHLLFLYRLNRRTEAFLWERLRNEISDEIHLLLKKDMKKYRKKCRFCEKDLQWDYPYAMCQKCHTMRYGKNYYGDRWE